jgi:hypothetical protein
LTNIRLEIRQEGTTEVCESIALNEGGKADFDVRICWVGPGELSSAFLLIKSLQNPNGLDVFEVCSLPIVFGSSSASSGSDVEEMQEMGVQCCRPVWIGRQKNAPQSIGSPVANNIEPPVLSRPILIAEAGGQLGIAGKVWDSSVVLIDFLSRHPERIRGKRCVELGSGTGLVGIAGWLLGVSSMVLTDLEEAMPLMRANIKLNTSSEVAGRKGA